MGMAGVWKAIKIHVKLVKPRASDLTLIYEAEHGFARPILDLFSANTPPCYAILTSHDPLPVVLVR